jgi:hypothetical protein
MGTETITATIAVTATTLLTSTTPISVPQASLIDWLRDPIWQFLGALLTIVVFAIGYFITRQSRGLSFEIVVNSKVFKSAAGVSERVQLLVDGKPLEDASLLVVKIVNSGNQPINERDYSDPIKIQVENYLTDPTLLSAQVIATSPDNPLATIRIEGNRAVLSPVLLNCGKQELI